MNFDALRDYQKECIGELRKGLINGHRSQVLVAPTGAGKCLGKNTPVLMFDGHIKLVQDVVVGDLLMGPDSKPRKVLSVTKGLGPLYRVTPNKGDPYVVNDAHILSLKMTGGATKWSCEKSDTYKEGKIHNVSVMDYLSKSKTFKHCAKGWRTAVDFPKEENASFLLHPYFLGVWIGDGISRGPAICTADKEIVDFVRSVANLHGLKIRIDEQQNNAAITIHITSGKYVGRSFNSVRSALSLLGLIKNKHIPHEYLTASRQDRLELLAGLLDTDGSLSGGGFDFIQKNESIACDVAFLARSLGLAAYISKCKKTCGNNGKVGNYFRVSISGDCSIIPTRIPRKKAPKRAIKKNPLHVGISVAPIGRGEYFGFEIDGDRLFLLGDFTVTHNTVIASYLLGEAYNKQSRAFFVCDRVSLVDQTSATLDAYGVPHGVIQANHWRARLWEHIQVVSAQTLARRELPYTPRLLVWDECFVENSMVYTPSGMKPIQLVRSGELIYNAIGVGRVVGVSAKPANKRKIVKVRFEDGTEIRCTEEHRFFTTKSWVQAGKLAGKSVIRIEDMPHLWGSFQAKDLQDKKRIHGISTKRTLGYSKNLLSVLCEEIEEPNAFRIVTAENGNDIAKNWAQTKDSWWKRKEYAAFAAKNVGETWSRMDSGICSALRDGSEREGAFHPLQNRYSESIENDCNRSGRGESWINKETTTRCKEDKFSCGIRVVSVEVEERKSDAVVYNLHISGHPSYFVDGKLVHNCHALYQSVLDYCKDESIKVIGLTATPFTKGMGKVFTNVVNSTTTNKLIDQKWLVPLKMYAAKEIDMTDAEIKFDGEWKDEEIEKRGIKITGDIVEEWISKTHEHFGGPVKTIVFSATVAHGDELCRAFQQRGYNFQQISYKDGNGDHRRKLIEEFRKPDSSIVGLVSCEALAKGFDVTDIKIGIGARPYRKSLSGHIQQLGRAMRSHPGKEFALWLDHAGNVLRFLDDTQEIFENGVGDLSTKEYDAKVRKEKTEKEKTNAKCSACGFVHTQRICPACGHERKSARSTVENTSGKMVEVSSKKAPKLKAHEWQADKKRVWGELCYIGYEIKRSDQLAEKFALAQYRNIYGVWPEQKYSTSLFVKPSREVRNKVRSQLIAYKNAMRKAA